MSGRTRIAGAAAVAALGLAVGGAPAAGADDAAGSPPERVVVVFERGVPASERAAVRAAAETSAVRTLGRQRFQLLKPKPGQSVAEAVAELRDRPQVAAADPDVTFRPSAVPNDPLFGQLWGLRNTGQNVGGVTGGVAGADIDATLAWDRTVGNPTIVVADLDTGYAFDHPDLAPVAWTNADEAPGNDLDDDGNGYVDDWRGWDAFEGDNDPTDTNGSALFGGHGVHTAGTIGAKGGNGIGVTGAAQDVRIMPVRVLGPFGGSLSMIVEGMNYAGLNGARAANMSLNASGQFTVILETLAANQQTLFVVSAGNNGTDNDAAPKAPCYDPTVPLPPDPDNPFIGDGYTPLPGVIDNVVCVAATDQADALASFLPVWASNYGATSVDLGAPGTEILSTSYGADRYFFERFDGQGFETWTTPAPPADDVTQGFVQRPDIDWVTNDPTTQLAGTTRATQSPVIAVPAWATTCQLALAYQVAAAGDDEFSWSFIADGAEILRRTEEDTMGGQPLIFVDVPLPASQAPRQVVLRFAFHKGIAGKEGASAILDNMGLNCSGEYRLDAGTSMATPHVTGTAGLLFSLKPSATVTQVRNALLAGVDPLPSLAGKTATGGRLNAWKALAALVPMDTRITSGPPAGGKATNATFNFDTNNTGNAGFQCSLDGGAFQPCTNPQSYKSLPVGQHTFSVRSAVPGGVDTTPATKQWTVTKSK